METFDNFKNAIVQQAAEDYAAAYMGGMIGKKKPKDTMRECEEFFHSDWYADLTNGAIDGDWLARNVKIREMEKAVKAYEAILDPFNSATIRATVALPRGKGTPCSMTYVFPPRFVSAIMDILIIQLESIQAELTKLEDANKEDERV